MSSQFSAALAEAIRLHSGGDLPAAVKAYRAVLACGLREGRQRDLAFSNYGALLKELGRRDDALLLYRLGERYFPDSIAVLRNHANLLFEDGHAQQALSRYLRAEIKLPHDTKPGKREAIQRQQAAALVDLGFPKLALSLLEPCLRSTDPAADTSTLRLGMADLYLQLGNRDRALQLSDGLLETDQAGLGEIFQQCNLLLQLGFHDRAINRFNYTLATHQRRLAELDSKIKIKYHSTCWNFALMLLRRGLFERGWELYEHGRWVPNGRGGMQRTVFKRHSGSKLPEWDGSPLTGQRLLINGEQGIGDVMMFSSLIPTLCNEASHVGIVTYDRLTSIYKRSFPQCTIYDTKDFKADAIPLHEWTLQTPIGSIPRYRFQSLESYGKLGPFLKADPLISSQYKHRFADHSYPLIGFSWRGGGNAKQKRTKSLRLDDLLPLFRLPNLRWISLQYGSVNEEICRFSHAHDLGLLTADDVDPLTDMDRWLSLVQACDYVVSAANTTIHGSGSIGIPTSVILAKDPDWRWIGDDSSNCYWYSCVHVVRQVDQNSWEEPVSQLRSHLLKLFPLC